MSSQHGVWRIASAGANGNHRPGLDGATRPAVLSHRLEWWNRDEATALVLVRGRGMGNLVPVLLPMPIEVAEVLLLRLRNSAFFAPSLNESAQERFVVGDITIIVSCAAAGGLLIELEKNNIRATASLGFSPELRRSLGVALSFLSEQEIRANLRTPPEA